MKSIFLEGSKLRNDVAGGITNYLANLFLHLSNIAPRSNMECKLHLMDGIPDRNIYVSQMRLNTSNTAIDSRIAFARNIFLGTNLECDIYHSLYMLLPPKRKGRVNVLTVCDMINLERSFTVRNKLREFMMRLAIRRADFYICISHATKERLLFHYPKIDKKKIFVTHLGVGSGFSNDKLLPSAPPAKPFLLYVGQRRDYKNFNSLLEAMSKSSFLSAFDVLCVGGGPFSQNEITKMSELKVNDKVNHAGYTSESDLKKLYQQATALAFTSLTEGFGLPIIEAMACRCPVICGNFSSMKEIAGDKALLVDNFSVESFETAVKQAVQFSDAQKEDARKHAMGFTWERTAKETLVVYKSIVN
jgi:glycosyltransferase involved in cell wall biosynthesis